MPTAQVLMDRAFRSLGALRVGASAASDMQSEGLAMLNALIDRERTSKLNVPQILLVQKTLTAGSASYSVGTSQDIDIARPIDIEDTSYLRHNSQDYPLVKLTRQEYNLIGSKSEQGMPTCFFYDNRFPIGYIFFYPRPDQAYAALLNYWAPISSFANAATNQDLSPAAESFLWTNLALDLLPLYPNPDVAVMVERAANRSRMAFGKSNVRVPILRHDFVRSAYNAVSD